MGLKDVLRGRKSSRRPTFREVVSFFLPTEEKEIYKGVEEHRFEVYVQVRTTRKHQDRHEEVEKVEAW